MPTHKAQSTGTVTYVYTDPQGTPLAEADANGNITATYDYTPYGTTALGTPPSGPGYTGHVNDPETNLVYMQARYYDAATGHFLSVDPSAPSSGNAFNFNRYDYANNNPILNIDPNGRETGQAYAAEFRMMGGVPQTYISPNDQVGPAIQAGLSILPVVGDGINIGDAVMHPSTATIAAAVVGAVPVIGGTAAKAIKETAAVAAHIPSKGAAAGEAVQLAKKLASESQVAELASGGGTVTHGADTEKALTQADRLAGQYGGKAEDYQKVSSSSYTASDGSHVETHAYRDQQSGQVIEPKTIVNPSQQ